MMQMTQSVELPSWMIQPPNAPSVDEGKSIVQIRKELQEKRFENFFESILERLEHGELLTDIIKGDRRDFDYSGILRWIMKDPQRRSRYYEAQEIGTELIVDEAIKIADCEDGLEDVQRSKIKIDTRIWAVKARNRKRYGDVKTLEVNQNISITAALEQANARVPHLGPRVIDHEDIE